MDLGCAMKRKAIRYIGEELEFRTKKKEKASRKTTTGFFAGV
jgi:hypothetical protein